MTELLPLPIKRVPQSRSFGVCRLIRVPGAGLSRIFLPYGAKLSAVRKFVRIRPLIVIKQRMMFLRWAARQNDPPTGSGGVWYRSSCAPSGVWNMYARYLCGNPAFCPYCYGRRIRELFERITRNAVKFRGVVLIERTAVVPTLTKVSYMEVKARLSKEAQHRGKQLIEKSVGFATVSLAYPSPSGYTVRVTRIEVLAPESPPPLSMQTSVYVDLLHEHGVEVLERIMHELLEFPRELLYATKDNALFVLWLEARRRGWLPVLVGGGELADNANS